MTLPSDQSPSPTATPPCCTPSLHHWHRLWTSSGHNGAVGAATGRDAHDQSLWELRCSMANVTILSTGGGVIDPVTQADGGGGLPALLDCAVVAEATVSRQLLSMFHPASVPHKDSLMCVFTVADFALDTGNTLVLSPR
eukprot:CAMPEP_0171078318 /NCGR_PEP_ID=MMETSP0766_2-20121228/14575_1 /TAXON_ID=439317 /ORGANISM="Gambierdiscus australes, Strain CAWD 149" /LENGTH=138 /DNA_ID=CAMNT_0011535439 /DNA_START=13 /DNA_END=426 /DNA_ORIENTATION=-